MTTKAPLHLTASMRAIQAHQGKSRMFSVAAAKRTVLAAAGETSDPDLLALRPKLERACRCTIAELAKVAATWPDAV